ncbi:MAG: sugar phosphate isomerase/epimerase [Opitutaceae bacterium]|nr:sugar phosphate isomerase/epimerase [Opitutaceae bacterium]
MKKPPVALQLWSLRDDCQKDFATTVAAVAKAGYRGVELAGYGNLDAPGAAQAIARAGLKVSGMHVGLPRLRSELAQVIKEARLFGTRQLICPYRPKEDYASAAACQDIGAELNAIGAALRGEDLKFSFHNHAAEFATVDGRRVFDWILDAAEPRNLHCQLDVYWAHVGGKDPAAFIREQGRRIELIHLKDETELGLGPVNFTEVFAAADAIGAVEWYVVEQEKYHHAPLESVRLCFEQLQRWGRA